MSYQVTITSYKIVKKKSADERRLVIPRMSRD